VGLSLIFGLMDKLNLAHGSLYLVGAYMGVYLASLTGSFLLALVGGVVSTVAIGLLIHFLLCHRYATEVIPQVLLTLGCLFIIGDLALWIFGGTPVTMPKPSWLSNPIEVRGITFPTYRLFVIAVGGVLWGFLWWFQERTGFGALIRAGVDDKDIAEAVGINISQVMIFVFGIGALMAGIAGVVGCPFLGAYPGVDFDVLVLTIVVVVIGGLGSLPGALMASLMVGLVDSIGKALFPQISMFLIFAVVVIVLALKPTGLLGHE
jgi:branched-chain amino acid transport system permease protein